MSKKQHDTNFKRLHDAQCKYIEDVKAAHGFKSVMELAKVCGLSPSTISRFQNEGDHNLSATTLERIYMATGIPFTIGVADNAVKSASKIDTSLYKFDRKLLEEEVSQTLHFADWSGEKYSYEQIAVIISSRYAMALAKNTKREEDDDSNGNHNSNGL